MSPASPFRFRSPAGLAILAGVLLLLFAAGAWLKSLATRAPERLPDLGPAPAFSARDARGRPWTNADLAGKIWIADALTPECGGCLVRNLRMTDLQTSLSRAGDVALVTFVADPALSAASKLGELERTFGALPGRWTFVSGASPFPGTAFVVVDARGRVRARVADSEPALSSRLLDGVGDLLRERRNAAP
ncbi:MAG TPA: hypothetical protein VKH46_01660 [Thermoanaerobaculia bacterium]|nr:hypothetical protein [Thermoanaerobaculia bacterium]